MTVKRNILKLSIIALAAQLTMGVQTASAWSLFGGGHASASTTTSSSKATAPMIPTVPFVDVDEALKTDGHIDPSKLQSLNVANATAIEQSFVLVNPVTGQIGLGPSPAYSNGEDPYAVTAQNLWAAYKQLTPNSNKLIVSFGGAAGTYISEYCTTPAGIEDRLKALYNAIKDSDHYTDQEIIFDFDIEHKAETSTQIDNLVSALAELRGEHKDLHVAFTLGQIRNGIVNANELNTEVFELAEKHQLQIAYVNGMFFDYGGKAMSDPTAQPGGWEVDMLGNDFVDKDTSGSIRQFLQGTALYKMHMKNNITDGEISGVVRELRSKYLDVFEKQKVKVGVTFMSGRHDSAGEITAPEDASIVSQALKRAYPTDSPIEFLSYWEAHRDVQLKNNELLPGLSSSDGIPQDDGAFFSYLAGNESLSDFDFNQSGIKADNISVSQKFDKRTGTYRAAYNVGGKLYVTGSHTQQVLFACNQSSVSLVQEGVPIDASKALGGCVAVTESDKDRLQPLEKDTPLETMYKNSPVLPVMKDALTIPVLKNKFNATSITAAGLDNQDIYYDYKNGYGWVKLSSGNSGDNVDVQPDWGTMSFTQQLLENGKVVQSKGNYFSEDQIHAGLVAPYIRLVDARKLNEGTQVKGAPSLKIPDATTSSTQYDIVLDKSDAITASSNASLNIGLSAQGVDAHHPGSHPHLSTSNRVQVGGSRSAFPSQWMDGSHGHFSIDVGLRQTSIEWTPVLQQGGGITTYSYIITDKTTGVIVSQVEGMTGNSTILKDNTELMQGHQYEVAVTTDTGLSIRQTYTQPEGTKRQPIMLTPENDSNIANMSSSTDNHEVIEAFFPNDTTPRSCPSSVGAPNKMLYTYYTDDGYAQAPAAVNEDKGPANTNALEAIQFKVAVPDTGEVVDTAQVLSLANAVPASPVTAHGPSVKGSTDPTHQWDWADSTANHFYDGWFINDEWWTPQITLDAALSTPRSATVSSEPMNSVWSVKYHAHALQLSMALPYAGSTSGKSVQQVPSGLDITFKDVTKTQQTTLFDSLTGLTLGGAEGGDITLVKTDSNCVHSSGATYTCTLHLVPTPDDTAPMNVEHFKDALGFTTDDTPSSEGSILPHLESGVRHAASYNLPSDWVKKFYSTNSYTDIFGSLTPPQFTVREDSAWGDNSLVAYLQKAGNLSAMQPTIVLDVSTAGKKVYDVKLTHNPAFDKSKIADKWNNNFESYPYVFMKDVFSIINTTPGQYEDSGRKGMGFYFNLESQNQGNSLSRASYVPGTLEALAPSKTKAIDHDDTNLYPHINPQSKDIECEVDYYFPTDTGETKPDLRYLSVADIKLSDKNGDQMLEGGNYALDLQGAFGTPVITGYDPMDIMQAINTSGQPWKSGDQIRYVSRGDDAFLPRAIMNFDVQASDRGNAFNDPCSSGTCSQTVDLYYNLPHYMTDFSAVASFPGVSMVSCRLVKVPAPAPKPGPQPGSGIPVKIVGNSGATKEKINQDCFSSASGAPSYQIEETAPGSWYYPEYPKDYDNNELPTETAAGDDFTDILVNPIGSGTPAHCTIGFTTKSNPTSATDLVTELKADEIKSGKYTMVINIDDKT